MAQSKDSGSGGEELAIPGFSHRICFPVQGTTSRSGRVILDWRGIPLALHSEHKFEAAAEGSTSIFVAKCWLEGGKAFVKLVHPKKGWTVDYSIRYLFEREGHRFALLEMAPGGPHSDDPAPTLTVVELVSATRVRSLTSSETRAHAVVLQDALRSGTGTPVDQIERVLGRLAPWENPDYLDEGNLHRVCPHCSQFAPQPAEACASCGESLK